jgi:hypothetical protein
MGGSSYVKSKVREYAVQWNQFSSVTFQFVDDPSAEIRVSFVPGGSNSQVGTDCLDIPQGNASMNFGWFDDQTKDDEFSRVVLHEFGHALGLIHEHQNPSSHIPWNKPKVYKYYKSTQGWTQEQVNHNIFEFYDQNITNFSTFDRKSIMLYPIPASLTINNSFEVGWNRTLSETDKTFIGTVYPKNATSSNGIEQLVQSQ